MSENKFHFFICFSSTDEEVARGVVQSLEERELTCWISARDVAPGQNYQETIVHALEKARGIVFLFSHASGQSREIMKELSLGGALNVPVFPLRLEPVTPSGAMRYELATRQWVDIFPDREAALDKLAATIKAVLRAPAKPRAAASTPAAPDAAKVAPLPPADQPDPLHAPIVEAGSEAFEAIRSLLARHIGPIAKIMVQKAAIEARTPDDFCERLAAHVSAGTERTAFMQAARLRLSRR